jgi:hypothetical protein
MVSNKAGLAELDTGGIKLMDEEAGHSNKCLQISKCLLERQERYERLDPCVMEVDSDADDF